MPTGGTNLRVTVGDRSFLLGEGESLRVGRDSVCDAVVDDPLISRTHLLIESAPQGWTLRDLDSRNGTFLAGHSVDVVPVGPGGVEVRLGAPDGPAVSAVVDGAPGQRPAQSSEADSSQTVLAARPRSRASNASATEVPVRTVRIGRAPDNDLVLDDLLVSRHHAEVHFGAEAQLVDLSSANGTFVNGHKIDTVVVGRGDSVGIGQSTFRITLEGVEEWSAASEVRFAASGLSVRTRSGEAILEDIDLAVDVGAFLAVVGPSGAGKSTLLGALTGMRPADVGTVTYEGRDLYAEYDELRSRIGLVPQDDVVHPQLTVRQALSYAAELRFPRDVSKQEQRARVDEVIDQLRLAARADLPIRQLSGGQRKRVSVAMELLTKPPVLFLDEPTSGLDPGLERDLMVLLRRLADEGRIVIVVTHSVASLHLCDRLLILAPGGRPAYFGPPAGAPQFFGQSDFESVFQLLSQGGEVNWPDRFAASPDRQRYLPERSGSEEVRTASASSPTKARGSFQDFRTLTHRYARLTLSDRPALILMAVQPILAGLLQFLVLPRHQLAPPGQGTLRIASTAATILFNPVQIATFVGLSNAVTQLVRERAVFRRERSVGLSIPAYLASKLVVLAIIAGAQAAVLATFVMIGQGGPTSALALGRPLIELAVVIGLTEFAAMTLGLMISALSVSEMVAITIVPIVFLVENVLTLGGLSPGALDKPVLNQAQYFSSSQWGFAAEAATADLNHLEGLSSLVTQVSDVNVATLTKLANGPLTVQGERRYRHLRSIWFEDMGAILALAVAGIVATGLALARGDPKRRS